MIYTVTLNPSLDYHLSTDGLRIGEVNRLKGERILPGGKGINISIVLKRFGIENIILGFAAGAAGKELERLLQERGLRAELIYLQKGSTRINVKIHDNGQDTDLNAAGSAVTEADLDNLMRKFQRLKKDDWLIMSGNKPPAVSDNIYHVMGEAVSARGVKTVVDATGKVLLEALPCHPFLIKPNIHELSEIFAEKPKGKDWQDRKEFAVYYGKKLRESGARNVFVSMDKDGALLIDEHDTVYEEKAPEGILKNSVGAGDSAVAGFVAGFLRTGEMKSALRYGVCAGSASAFSEDLASYELTKNLLERDI